MRCWKLFSKKVVEREREIIIYYLSVYLRCWKKTQDNGEINFIDSTKGVVLVSCPARACLPARNSWVNKVEF